MPNIWIYNEKKHTQSHSLTHAHTIQMIKASETKRIKSFRRCFNFEPDQMIDETVVLVEIANEKKQPQSE